MTDFREELEKSLNALRQGNLALARDYSDGILEKDKTNAGAWRLISQIEFIEGNIDQAISAMEKSLKSKPDQYSLWVKLGNAFADKGAFEKAEAAYSAAVSHSPSPFLAYFWRGQANEALGKKDQAFNDLEEAIKLNPAFGQAYRLMVKLENPKAQTPDFIQGLEQRLALKVFPREEAIHAHYALAGIYEGKSDYAPMWRHLKQANALQFNLSKPWEQSYRMVIERSKELFTKDFIAAHPEKAASDMTPIFIVGTPRSGSTLLDKMLCAHPQIAGGGETGLIPRMVGMIQEETILSYPNGIEFLEDDFFQNLSDFYLTGLKNLVGGAAFGTDKLVSNTFFVGLIKKLIPRAKIVYLRRDPLDTAFSIYKNYFWEGQTPEYCSQENIAKYFRMTGDLMAFWKQDLDIDIHEITYEDLVTKPEPAMKSLLTYIGVPWDDACLDHTRGKTLSKTLSTAQVEKPLYQDSVGIAENFREQLAPFLKVYEGGNT